MWCLFLVDMLHFWCARIRQSENILVQYMARRAVRACVRAFVHACLCGFVCACVRSCVRECLSACVRVYVRVCVKLPINGLCRVPDCTTKPRW